LAFLRVVEVFPPLFPGAAEDDREVQLRRSIDDFVGDVNAIRGVADVVVVASLKKPHFPALSTIEASLQLRRKLGLDAAPVIVVRDQDRLQFLSSAVAGLVGGLKSMVLVWGDPGEARRSPKLIGFAGLSEALSEATRISERGRSRCRLFAPVDLRRLVTARGVRIARERLSAGASFLLAQPPATDSAETFDYQSKLVRAAGLEGKVLLSVFPFRSSRDVIECERYFGWKLPKSLHAAAKEGESSLLQTQKEVVRRLRSEHFPGVYVSTRGNPAIAKEVLS